MNTFSEQQSDRFKLSVVVNGVRYEEEVEPRLLLVDFLRTRLRLTGTHVGCDTSSCGACTVLLGGESVKACTMFAVQAEGQAIMTVEGLAPGDEADHELHPLQKAFSEHHALQCGFCTPGMMLSALDLLNRNPDPTESEIRTALAGNICRCTGYHNIVAAVTTAARELRNEG